METKTYSVEIESNSIMEKKFRIVLNNMRIKHETCGCYNNVLFTVWCNLKELCALNNELDKIFAEN